MKRQYKIDVYDALLIIANDRKSAMMEDEYPEGPNCSLWAHNHKWAIVIYLPDNCLRKACHESVHGAIDLLCEIGYKLDRGNQEPVAWLTDFIFSKCQDFIMRLPNDASDKTTN